jgi:hypothetical protein
MYPIEINRFLNVVNQARASGEAQVGDLRWIERWLLPRIKRRAGGWTDYPPKARRSPAPTTPEQQEIT